MSDRQNFIVVSYGHGMVWVNSTRDLPQAFRQWRRNGRPDSVPVAVIELDRKTFLAHMPFGTLPVALPAHKAAPLFHLLPIAPAAQLTVAKELKRLGALAAPMLMQWTAYVNAARGT